MTVEAFIIENSPQKMRAAYYVEQSRLNQDIPKNSYLELKDW